MPRLVHSLGSRGLAFLVSATMAVPASVALVPATVHAAAPADAPPPQDNEAALAESRAFYEEGKAKFDTFDYNGAVELWTRAYSRLPEDAAGVRNAMVYNIATAQEKAYDVDKELLHLRQAVLLLESYTKNYKALYKKTPETQAEIKKAEERIALLKERIAAAERGEPEPTGAPVPVAVPVEQPAGAEPLPANSRFGSGEVDGIQWNTGHSPPVDEELVAKNQRLADADKKTDGLFIGSYIAFGVGGVLTLAGVSAVLAGNAVDEPEDPDEPDAEDLSGVAAGTRGAGYGTLALGLSGVIAGVVLVAVALDRRKRARAGTLVSATPVVGRKFAGVALRGRF